MNLISRTILALILALQPLLLQAQALASCEREPVPAAVSAGPMACCEMVAAGEQCTCAKISVGRCDCSTAPTQTPASPERTAKPVPDFAATAAATIFSCALAPEVPSLAALALSGKSPRTSADSIQSLLCVWRT